MTAKNGTDCTNLKTLFKHETTLCGDSVEWCPHKPHRNYFVCGNYELTEEDTNDQKGDTPRKRIGAVLLFSISPNKGLKLHQAIHTGAVLDQKWCHNEINGLPVLGVVTAQKKLEIYQLKENELHLITSFELHAEGDLLILSLDWSTGKYKSEEPNIVCTDSKGKFHIFQLANGQLEKLATSEVHGYEAWIGAFYYWDPNIFFTGGDDSLLLKFDQRVGSEPILRNKSHQAGVTSLHSNFETEYVIASGSYDCCLRLWDVRKMKAPTDDVEMPGTIWRLKYAPFSCQWLLAACMLGGAHIVNTAELQICESYYEHKNITYGCDWSHLLIDEVCNYPESGSRIVATCSFYDRLLCVSKATLE